MSKYISGKAYWLASRCVNADSSSAYFNVRFVYSSGGATGVSGYNLFFSDSDEYDYGLAVRPVVVLKSNVTEDSIHKIDDQTEEEWNYQAGA